MDFWDEFIDLEDEDNSYFVRCNLLQLVDKQKNPDSTLLYNKEQKEFKIYIVPAFYHFNLYPTEFLYSYSKLSEERENDYSIEDVVDLYFFLRYMYDRKGDFVRAMTNIAPNYHFYEVREKNSKYVKQNIELALYRSKANKTIDPFTLNDAKSMLECTEITRIYMTYDNRIYVIYVADNIPIEKVDKTYDKYLEEYNNFGMEGEENNE